MASRGGMKLIELAKGLPGFGVGSRVAKPTWPADTFWTVTAVKPGMDGRNGKAWGILTWRGSRKQAEPTRIGAAQKSVWVPFPGDGDVSTGAWKSTVDWRGAAAAAASAPSGEE